jgi:ClpP class serine protease
LARKIQHWNEAKMNEKQKIIFPTFQDGKMNNILGKIQSKYDEETKFLDGENVIDRPRTDAASDEPRKGEKRRKKMEPTKRTSNARRDHDAFQNNLNK